MATPWNAGPPWRRGTISCQKVVSLTLSLGEDKDTIKFFVDLGATMPGALTGTALVDLRAMNSLPSVSTPEEEDDVALCSMCRSETPPDEIFWCLSRGCDYAFFGVCFECLVGHVCVLDPFDPVLAR